jgi:hypothetical protein
VIRERLTAQLLAGRPARTPLAVVKHLLAVQGQDAKGARLAIRARTAGLTAADVDRSLSTDRSLVITWLGRGTLHLVASEDYPWLHALTTPQLLTANTRRLAQEGVDPGAAERGVAAIERSLAAEGPLTRLGLRERVARAGVPTEGQALVHLLALASLRGLIVRGPMVDRQHAYVLVRDWLGERGSVTRSRGAVARHRGAIARDVALTELARRYLAGHGPADERDLARWAGITLGDARAGLTAIGGELEVREDGLVDLAGRPPPEPVPGPRLLGPFDPLLMGWRSREPVLGRHHAEVVGGGMFRAIALVRGRAVATWRMPAGRVVIEPFARLARSDRAALEDDARDVERFLGESGLPVPT